MGLRLSKFANVVVVGGFAGTGDFNPSVATFSMTSAGSIDTFECKLNSAGNFVWARRMGSLGVDCPGVDSEKSVSG